jgi:hypothetical protein
LIEDGFEKKAAGGTLKQLVNDPQMSAEGEEFWQND